MYSIASAADTVNPVRARRIALRMTLAETAQRSGLDITTVGRLDRGKAIGSFKSQKAIARALGDAPVDELFPTP